MEQYLCETPNMDFSNNEIQKLIDERGWKNLDEFHKIEAIYDFVKEEIKFGYNTGDNISASTVLHDGIGQCNTKACLLMTLLRAVGIPSRIHAFCLNHEVQKGVIPPSQYRFAPVEILHTWAEVLYQNHWIVLEGVILDDDYIKGFIDRYCKINAIKQNEIQRLPYKYGFKGYGFGVDDLFELKLRWTGENTYVQSTGIIRDLGVFSSADECFRKYEQKIGPIKKSIYTHITRKIMNKRVERLRHFSKSH